MKCPICEIRFFDINSNDSIYSSPCGHVMHKDCLITWIRSNNSCPICRKHCTESNIFQLFLSANMEEDQDQRATLSAIQRLETSFCSSNSEVNHKFDEISNMFGNFSLTFSTWEEKNKNLIEENENLQDQIKGMQAETNDLHKKIIALQDNLDIEKSNFRELRDANASFVAELREKNGTIKKLEKKIQDHENNIQVIDFEFVETASGVKFDAAEMIRSLENQVETFKEEVQFLTAANQKLQEEIDNNINPKILTLTFDNSTNAMIVL